MSNNAAEIEQDHAIEGAMASAISESPEQPSSPAEPTEPAKPVTLVIEVPFDPVRRRGETSRMVGAPVSVREAYLKALAAEVAGAGDVLDGRRIASIEVRGSAAMLPCDGLARLFRNLRRSHDVDARGDFVLEMTPLTVGTPSLTSLNGCRFRTLRLDAFSADKSVRSYLGLGPASEVGAALAFLEKFGYSKISMRCVYGVPGMTERTMRGTVDLLDETSQVKEFVLFSYENAQAEGVSEGDLVRQYEAAASHLASRGFAEYAPGRFFHNDGRDGAFLDRVAGMDRLGFGAGAISLVDGMMWRNTSDIAAYIAGNGEFECIVCEAREVGIASEDASEGASESEQGDGRNGARQAREALRRLRMLEPVETPAAGSPLGDALRELEAAGLVATAPDAGSALDTASTLALTTAGRALFGRVEARLRDIAMRSSR